MTGYIQKAVLNLSSIFFVVNPLFMTFVLTSHITLVSLIDLFI